MALVRRPGRRLPPPPSVVIRHAQWPWAQASKPQGWSICPGANAWCPENLHHQPVGDLFQSWLVLSLTRQERLSPSSTHASQPYTACKLTTPPWNGFLQPGILKHDHEHVPYFPGKTARDPRQRDMVAYFWTAPTAWFQGGTGPNSGVSPWPSVTSYRCSVEGFHLTVVEHRTPWKTSLKAIGVKPQFSQHSSWGAWQSRWCPNSVTNLVNFLQYGFWENEFKVWIYYHLWWLLH